MNRRALLIALVVAALGGLLLLLYQQRFEREASGGERIKLLVALKPIERGKALAEDMLDTRDVPLAYVEDRAIRAADKSKILGLKLGVSLQPQQTLMWTDLVGSADERRDPATLIQPGNRAVTIRAGRDDTSSTALIRPGNYVDVIAVLPQPGQAEQKSAAVLLQRVLVVAVGSETSPEGSEAAHDRARSERESMLTVSVTLSEAQLLALATEKGRLMVALRNPTDQPRPPQPDLPSSTLLNVIEREQIKGVRRPTGPTRLEEQR
ncbi:MAG: Flp pilus assembly protein CpaB [Myxococcales bacterium]|nr:Flp pilus assembly protein CpaB [Myxococcales bacterium]